MKNAAILSSQERSFKGALEEITNFRLDFRQLVESDRGEAILRDREPDFRAASAESLFANPERFPPKKNPKTGIML